MTNPTPSPDAVDAAAKIVAYALRHRQEQIEKGVVGDVQTQTPNGIAEEIIKAAEPHIRKAVENEAGDLVHHREKRIVDGKASIDCPYVDVTWQEEVDRLQKAAIDRRNEAKEIRKAVLAEVREALRQTLRDDPTWKTSGRVRLKALIDTAFPEDQGGGEGA